MTEGGPLVNAQGEVIAVATLADQRQTIQNISFAIPNETIKEFFADYLGQFCKFLWIITYGQ